MHPRVKCWELKPQCNSSERQNLAAGEEVLRVLPLCADAASVVAWASCCQCRPVVKLSALSGLEAFRRAGCRTRLSADRPLNLGLP